MCRVILPNGLHCSVASSILGLCTTHFKTYREYIINPLPLKYEGSFNGLKRCGVCVEKKNGLFHSITIALSKSRVPTYVCLECYNKYSAFKEIRILKVMTRYYNPMSIRDISTRAGIHWMTAQNHIKSLSRKKLVRKVKKDNSFVWQAYRK